MTSLTNADLAPVAPECRTWKTHNFAALWVGMALWIRCEGLYVYAWFIGFFVAGGVYRVLMAGTGARTGPGYAEGHG